MKKRIWEAISGPVKVNGIVLPPGTLMGDPDAMVYLEIPVGPHPYIFGHSRYVKTPMPRGMALRFSDILNNIELDVDDPPPA